MRVRVRVPATSANLGPGFDVLGLALALHNEIDAEEADGVSVAIEGEGAGRLETGERNVVARAVRMAFEAAGRPFRGVALRASIASRRAAGWARAPPPGSGGSWPAMRWPAAASRRDTLLELATRAEGHPDNVAAALLGGLTVSCWHRRARGRVVAAGAAGHPWVVLIPEIEGSTKEARAVLPASVSRADAVFNLQRVGLLLGRAARGAPRSPSRGAGRPPAPAAALAPLPVAARRGGGARASAGALGCVLSGAGPSLLAPVAGPGDAVAAAMETALRGKRHRAGAR